MREKTKERIDNGRENTTRGITLIALVVTIVVLIILATVSINIVLGENGLIKRAEKAKEIAEESSRKEQESLDELYEMIAEGKEDSTPGKIDGEGTAEKPYKIQSIEDLVAFSNKVAEGTTYEGETVKLSVNLDFNNDNSYVNPETTQVDEKTYEGGLKKALTTGTGFMPIGNNTNMFKGTFEGGNHTIKNLYIKDGTKDYVGLFGYINGSNSSIQNLSISNANIEAKQYVGGVVGRSDGGKIKFCNSSGNIKGKEYIGGICGYLYGSNAEIDNCVNSGGILVCGVLHNDQNFHASAGGIVGIMTTSSSVKNSCNKGRVEGYKENNESQKKLAFGGIAGECVDSSNIVSCYNEGIIGGSTSDIAYTDIGGICGSLASNSSIKKCYNLNIVKGKLFVGGIVGLFGWNSSVNIEDCYNRGEVETIEKGAGGICFVTGNCTEGTIKNCYNTGKVSLTNSNGNYIRRNCRN